MPSDLNADFNRVIDWLSNLGYVVTTLQVKLGFDSLLANME